MTVQDVLCRLEGLQRSGDGWVAKCRAHEDRNPSLSVRLSESGRVLLKCFAGCSYEAILAALDLQPRSALLGSLRGTRPSTYAESRKREYARRIWDESKPASGTLVETYLRSRGITIPAPPSLRFHPRLRHPNGTYMPAMVAAVQAVNGVIVAVHRTYLRSDGTGKADVEKHEQKLLLGPARGGAVRFARPAERIVIGEGIETMLSVLQPCPVLAVWAALTTSGLKSLELPSVVRHVIIAADPDASGMKAAREAKERFAVLGIKVTIVVPKIDGDFNDLLRR